jgi:hypothetical protein
MPEFLFFLFVLFVAFNVVRGFAAEAGKKRLTPPPEPEPWRLEEAAHTYRLGSGAAPAAQDPWWEVSDPEALPVIEVPREPEPVDLVVYDDVAGTMSVAPRPLPAQPVALDVEVDRTAEHARLHARIDRPPPRVEDLPRAPRLTVFHGPGALRRAILAAEVLGPPRALRDLDG